jgi:hypothetical protein
MARQLSDRDKEIMAKLVPEMADIFKSDSGMDMEYRNVLPPVAIHHSRDEEDFAERLDKLSNQDLKYLFTLIVSGAESLGCMDSELAEVFFNVLAARVSKDDADKARKAYESATECY